MKTKRNLLLLILGLTASVAMGQRTLEMNLWHGKPKVSSNELTDTAKVKVYLPKEKWATGRAVVICPGGGYGMLAIDHEGHQWASFFNNIGIAAIVLKYRLPHGNKEIPISDAEEAIRLVRRNASAWHIKRNDVGIMGSSAGGHLASTIATHAKGEAKPNFQILFYPVITMMQGYAHKGSRDNFLGSNASKQDERMYSNDMQVTRDTPRAWIALSDDDRVVMPSNGVNYYLELYRHDVPASLHVYPDGGHGWGRTTGFKYRLEMELDLKAWLQSF